MARKKSLNPILKTMIARLVAGYIWLIQRTLRWEFRGLEHRQKLLDNGENYIAAFWHGRLLMMPMSQIGHDLKVTALISEHSDGDVIADIMSSFGIEAQRGSSANPRKKEKNKGGAVALKSLVSLSKQGWVTGITPDGPRGPRQRAQAGVAQLAKLSGTAILPMTFSAKFGHHFSSWDRFFVPFPLPFSKAIFAYGEPIYVKGRGADAIESNREIIEKALNNLTEIADEAVGRKSPEPDDIPSPHSVEASQT